MEFLGNINWVLVFVILFLVFAVFWTIHIFRFFVRTKMQEKIMNKIDGEIKEINSKLEVLTKEFEKKMEEKGK